MWRAFVIAGLAAVCSMPAAAQVKDVEQMPEQFIELFRQGDLKNLTGLSAPDASYIPIVGPKRLEDVEGISGYYQKVFADSKSRNITFTNARWDKYGSVAVRSADVVIDLDLKDGSRRSTPSRVSFVYRQGPQGWQIVHYHGSPRSTPPASPAASGAPLGGVPPAR